MYSFKHLEECLIRKYGWDRIPWFKSWKEVYIVRRV